MTLADIKAALDVTGYPVAYHHFSEPPELPYIVYLVPEQTALYADNASYFEKMTVRVELYTNTKCTEAEKKVCGAMSAAGMIFRHDGEAYIDSEKMYLNAYESEVI